jgi:glycosyltransferase involved in cell wall biosynthesis
MRVCFVCVEIFAWGKFGGFGRATRVIGRELVRRGHEVFAVVPRRADQRAIETLDGITIYGYEPRQLLDQTRLFKEIDADIYHSQEPSFGTYLAQNAMPHKKHVITLRDTRMWEDWKIEFNLPSLSRAQVIKNWLYEDNPLVHHAVRRADGLFAASHIVAARAVEKYHLAQPPALLPTPVQVPAEVQKSSAPQVCYVGRIDRRKRPEVFFELAREFPEVNFIALGKGRDSHWEKTLTDTYNQLPNLTIKGFVNQFQAGEHASTLSQSWVLINTSAREGLPNSMLEAAAYRCAILSSVNPDDFSSNFGYYAEKDDFSTGLTWLLADNRWKTQAEKGCQYILQNYEISKAIQQHLDVYRALLKDG